MFGVALVCLYALGVTGWRLAVGVILLGFGMAFVLAGPLDRVIPPRLEPFEAPWWKLPKQDKYGRLHLEERVDPEDDKQAGDSPPK
jgi:hypothetical protein